MVRVERLIIVKFVLRDQLLMNLMLIYYRKLEKVIEMQYHNERNKLFLFKCYWYDTTNRVVTVDHHHSLIKINRKARLRNVDNDFVFAKQCNKFITYTLFSVEMIVLVLIGYP